MLPLLGGLTTFFGMTPPMPTQSQFTYYGDVQNVASGMIPRILLCKAIMPITLPILLQQ